MKPEIKKLLILNLPYLLFVWLFDKVGAAQCGVQDGAVLGSVDVLAGEHGVEIGRAHV